MTCYCSLFLPLYFPGSSGLRGSVGTGAYQISKWAQWWIMSFTKLALIFLVNSRNVLSNSHLAMRVEVFTRVCSQMLAMFSINTILFLYYGCESFQVVLTSPVLLKKKPQTSVFWGGERNWHPFWEGRSKNTKIWQPGLCLLQWCIAMCSLVTLPFPCHMWIARWGSLAQNKSQAAFHLWDLFVPSEQSDFFVAVCICRSKLSEHEVINTHQGLIASICPVGQALRAGKRRIWLALIIFVLIVFKMFDINQRYCK